VSGKLFGCVHVCICLCLFVAYMLALICVISLVSIFPQLAAIWSKVLSHACHAQYSV